MDKRERFISDLRAEAKARGLPFSVNRRRGKGGHVTLYCGDVTLYCGDRLTTLPSRDIDPVTAGKIRKQLGLA